MNDGRKLEASSIVDAGFIDIARITSGGSFGELALIDGKPRLITVKALTRCHMLTISKKDFDKAL